MRTIFLVEKADLALLKSGQPWDLQIGGTTITLQMVGKATPKAEAPSPNGTPVLRRQYTDAFKAKVLAEYRKTKKAIQVAEKYGIRRDLIYSWMTTENALKKKGG